MNIGNYKLKDLLNSDHVFTTGTAAEIQKVKSIKEKKFNTNSKLIDFLKEKYEAVKKYSPNYIKEIKKA